MPKKPVKLAAKAPRNGPTSLAPPTVEEVLGAVLRIAPADVKRIREQTADAKGKGKRKGK
jgi:hypothetical protein